ncbi:2-oxoacid:acceptor oxidoreductase family protein [Magnetovibrio sp.]|uniref:2-oxoacid:acceptor oxidoreductase family protein n=1 Tax=Magnetovibrio sp. TaxID=2024836 RepID=UPI002F923F24
MLRIRFHGRGGQGMKTASRMLGSAFFIEGFEVQDAPRYGAERRGAPIFAYVRADTAPIHERGVIPYPDLALVADDTLVGVPAAGVLQGLDAHAVLALSTTEDADTWRARLNTDAQIVILPPFSAEDPAQRPYVGALLAGAAACLVGLKANSIIQAIAQELDGHGTDVIAANQQRAHAAYEAMAAHAALTHPRAEDSTPPDTHWVTLKHEDADTSAPTIHGAATSVQIKTGLWRTLRPVVDLEHCNRCNWVCGSFCPDGAISADKDGYPVIDLDHCKGCMICVAQCPPHAIHAVPEKEPEKGAAS